MQLNDLLNYGDLLKMRTHGYVKEQVHPKYNDLRILNYTQTAQFDGVWNEITEQCRGLIYCATTGEVVARPFKKFYNYGQSQCPAIDMTAPAVVMDKMDGSLGILYRVPGTNEFAIATRGSFDSDQARHATKLLNDKYADWLKDSRNRELFEEYTVLFEIVYPENRIVCDYQGMDDLVFLDSVNKLDGSSWGSDAATILFDWNGPVAETFEFANMAEALAAPSREGKEGFVVLFPETNERVKIKQEDYVALHRIVTGLNARTVWSHMQDGKPLSELVESIPDEFHEWVKEVWDSLNEQRIAWREKIGIEWRKTCKLAQEIQPGSRKAFAEAAKKSEYPAFMFLMLDSKHDRLEDKIMDMIKPAHDWTPSGKNFSEDVA